jgi:hypothetical protein
LSTRLRTCQYCAVERCDARRLRFDGGTGLGSFVGRAVEGGRGLGRRVDGAVAKRSDCDVVPYGTSPKKAVRAVGSVLGFAEDIHRVFGGGTNTWQSVEASFNDHDRVLILTDEQSHESASCDLPVPVYVWNLALYGVSTVDPAGGATCSVG